MNEEIDKKLIGRNIKPTAMRQLVLEVLLNHKTAISLPELEQKFERADKSTLYRTLKKFQEKKLIHSVEDGTGSLRYAVCDEFCNCGQDDLHIHFLCVKCNKTFCFHDMPVPVPKLPEGFLFESANFVIKGICANCRKKHTKNH